MADKQLNIYQKINKIRYELTKLGLKKTGKNTYSNYTYYEMEDFLPALNKLMFEIGITSKINIIPAHKGMTERAKLTLFNSDEPKEFEVWILETAEVEIGKKADGTGGADPIQNLGGKLTYMHRYMLIHAFNLAEPDLVDRKDQSIAVLDRESIKQLNSAKDLKELAAVCKTLKEKKGKKYHAALVEHYTARKEVLEEQAEVDQTPDQKPADEIPVEQEPAEEVEAEEKK